MKLQLIIILFMSSFSTQARESIEGHLFLTRGEYHKTGKPCACPSDQAKNGKCGKRAALCRNGGENILDCNDTKITSIAEYKNVKKKLYLKTFASK